MVSLDYAIILIYFVVVISLGFWYSKRASKSLDSYFLGGKKIHWLGLAMSGSVSNFDITGTMWIVSVIYLLGMKSMWHHWMWGFLMGAFFMSYMGKWVRRSNVMTAAEWMKTRFGDRTDGKAARITCALLAVMTVTAFVGYAYQGIGKFAAVYIPLENIANHTSLPWLQTLVTDYEPHCLAVVIMTITTLYVMLGGLYSVVATDVIQTIVLTAGSIFISFIAWKNITPDGLAALPDGWTSLSIPWRIDEFAGTDNAAFELFGILVIVWILKGLLLNLGGPAQMYDCQRFLAAQNERDAAKVGATWSLFLVVRWSMAAGIALLALTGATGTVDSEKVMPLILMQYLPNGIRGLVIAGLLAAFMSTFSSTINTGASFVVRDLWQPYFGKNHSASKAVKVSYAATIVIVVMGLFIGFQVNSIAQIWGWMMMSFTAGILIPNVLRWYWWRINGWGYSLGSIGGIVASLTLLAIDTNNPATTMPVYVTFPSVCFVSILFTVGVTLLTKPTDSETLIAFYRHIRPFGFWAPIKKQANLTVAQQNDPAESPTLTALNVLLGMIAIAMLYLFPMYLVGHWYLYAFICLTAALISVAILKFTWYNNLPAE